MNRIDQIFLIKEKLLSIYFTAGYPNLNDTIPILKKLQEAGVDLIEIISIINVGMIMFSLVKKRRADKKQSKTT